MIPLGKPQTVRCPSLQISCQTRKMPTQTRDSLSVFPTFRGTERYDTYRNIKSICAMKGSTFRSTIPGAEELDVNRTFNRGRLSITVLLQSRPSPRGNSVSSNCSTRSRNSSTARLSIASPLTRPSPLCKRVGIRANPRLYFRGLLRLHSRYGPLDCSTAQGGLCHEASIQLGSRHRTGRIARFVARKRNLIKLPPRAWRLTCDAGA
jgi:hypothetical protein